MIDLPAKQFLGKEAWTRNRVLLETTDSHLHQNIRQKERLPTETQVDFRAALDQLWSEVIRTA